jgi:hypothetical protein
VVNGKQHNIHNLLWFFFIVSNLFSIFAAKSQHMHFDDTHTISRKDFEEFGRRIGLAPRLVKRELEH